MADSRVCFVGTATSTTYTAANVNNGPGGAFGFVKVTADQGSITTETDATSLTVTVTVGASRRIKVSGCARASNSSSTGGCALLIYEGATLLDRKDAYAGVADLRVGLTPQAVLDPSTGSHTYKLRVDAVNSGTMTLRADATFPAFILVEDLGPTF